MTLFAYWGLRLLFASWVRKNESDKDKDSFNNCNNSIPSYSVLYSTFSLLKQIFPCLVHLITYCRYASDQSMLLDTLKVGSSHCMVSVNRSIQNMIMSLQFPGSEHALLFTHLLCMLRMKGMKVIFGSGLMRAWVAKTGRRKYLWKASGGMEQDSQCMGRQMLNGSITMSKKPSFMPLLVYSCTYIIHMSCLSCTDQQSDYKEDYEFTGAFIAHYHTDQQLDYEEDYKFTSASIAH